MPRSSGVDSQHDEHIFARGDRVEIFAAKKYFLSDEFSLVDCTIAPILWRLPLFNINLPPQARSIQRYMDEVFSRPSFQASLTEFEQEIRQ